MMTGERRERTFTPELLKELQLAYGGRKPQISAALDRLARRTGWPRYIFKTEARRQGWTRAQYRPWTPYEDACVREHAGAMSIKAIAHLLKRSHESVTARVALVQSIQQTREGYTPGNLVKLFGTRPEKVRRWIEKGLLGASRSFNPEARILGADLLRFIHGSVHEYDLATVDQEWFKAVVFEGKGIRGF
jgi:hypothetical protein